MNLLQDHWFLIIAGLVITYAVNRFAGFRERGLELAAKKRKGEARETVYDMDDLRAELLRLRDTSTQYDLSVERALTEFARRLAALERQAGLSTSDPQPLPSPLRESGKGKKNSSAGSLITTTSEQTLRLGRK